MIDQNDKINLFHTFWSEKKYQAIIDKFESSAEELIFIDEVFNLYFQSVKKLNYLIPSDVKEIILENLKEIKIQNFPKELILYCESGCIFNELKCLEKLCKHSIYRGEIKIARDLSCKVINQAKKLKRIEFLNYFVTDMKAMLGEKSELQSAQAFIFIQTGGKVGECYPLSDTLIIKKVKEKTYAKAFQEEFCGLEKVQRDHLIQNKDFQQAVIVVMWQLSDLSYIEISPTFQKDFLKAIYDQLVSSQDQLLLLIVLMKYSVLAENKKLLQGIYLYIESHYSKQQLRKYSNIIASLYQNCEKMTERARPQEDGELDLADDLFETNLKEGHDLEQRIDQRVRDIEFLKNKGALNDLIPLLYDLKEIAPTHPMVAEISEFERRANRDQKRDSATLERDLLIQFRNTNLSDHDQDISEISLKKTIEYLPESEIRTSYRDLFVSMLQIKFYRVCQYIIERMELLNNGLDRQLSMELDFFKIDLKMMQQNYFELIDCSMAMIEEYELTEDQLIHLYYQMAKSYQALEKYQNAKALYKKIIRMKKGYRLAQERLRKIEESK